MKTAHFFQRAADATLTGIEEVNMFALRLLARLSQPAVALGLMYWAVTSLAGYPLGVVPYWPLTWAIIQAIAIMTHLAVLPARAYQQAKAGERASWAISVVTLALLGVSSLTFLSQMNAPAFTLIRTLALIAVLFTEPVAQVQGELMVIIPSRCERGIPQSDPEQQERPIFNTQYTQD